MMGSCAAAHQSAADRRVVARWRHGRAAARPGDMASGEAKGTYPAPYVNATHRTGEADDMDASQADFQKAIRDTTGGATPQVVVTVVGVQIPFWNLVGLLVKIALASIPAAIIVAII